jgi:hypothetical protein
VSFELRLSTYLLDWILASMHATKGTPERDAYDKKLALMKEVMGSKSFFLPSLGRTDLSIKFHNRMQIASKFQMDAVRSIFYCASSFSGCQAKLL